MKKDNAKDYQPSDASSVKEKRNKFKKLIITLSIIGGVLVTIGLSYLYIFIDDNHSYHVTYRVEGVNQTWLDEHPFDTNGLPTTIKNKDRLVLYSPKIDSYVFVEWRLEIDKNAFSSGSSKTFKDGEPTKVGGLFSSLTVNTATITAKYAKI